MSEQGALHPRDVTILCVSSYFKGNEFIEQCKAEGCKVLLLTVQSLLERPWARHAIDEVFALESFDDRAHVVASVSWLMRKHDITRLAPLDDYDVELVALLREHLRIPGMGETTARYFRDKLAMRQRAQDHGIPVPPFVGALNHARIAKYLDEVPGPWLIKPRSAASAVGIQKHFEKETLWKALEALGDQQSFHVIEKMIPGDVFHVDSITWEKQILFAECHQYRRPLLALTTDGGVFGTRTVPRGSVLERQLLEANRAVIKEFGIVRGVTHTELIRGEDGTIYFLETAARVGGVHISDLVSASTGVNLWHEWAKIEVSQGKIPYVLPPRRSEYAALLVSLAKQEQPDTSTYTDPEIVWRMTDNPHHVGMVLRSPDRDRIEALMDEYEARFANEFVAALPPPDKPLA